MLPKYKKLVLWRKGKEKETIFWTVQAANLQNRLRTPPTPMPVCKTEYSRSVNSFNKSVLNSMVFHSAGDKHVSHQLELLPGH